MEYGKLTFTNNFVFCKVLENNLDLCRQLLELILSVTIKKVELTQNDFTGKLYKEVEKVR